MTNPVSDPAQADPAQANLAHVNLAQADPTTAALAEARHRELAIEHLLFGTIRFLARENPDLLTSLEASLDHLWDRGGDDTRDDAAVRDVARRFLKSLQAER